MVGQVLTIQRRITRPVRPGERCPRYVTPAGRPPRHPYGVELAAELAGEGVEVAYCEGAIDAVALGILAQQWGRQRIALGLPGTRGWRPEWASWARGRVAVVALDADQAGEEQVLTIAADLHEAGAVKVLRATPESGNDWNDELMKDTT